MISFAVGLPRYLILQKFKLARRPHLKFPQIFSFVVYFEPIELIVVYFIFSWENSANMINYKHVQKIII